MGFGGKIVIGFIYGINLAESKEAMEFKLQDRKKTQEVLGKIQHTLEKFQNFFSKYSKFF